jgi:hypothetical protein
MRRAVGLVVLVAVVAGLGAGSASAGGAKKLVEGTVYDTTCATSCGVECPPPPHCGPITSQSRTDVVCAQAQRRRIVACPLAESSGATPDFCIQGEPCGVDYPVYSGEGAIVKVRKRGSAGVLATVPIVEGHFKIRLGAGEYVIHPYLPEENCWSGEPGTVKVLPSMKSPVLATLDVSNRCVVHPDAAK